jgi:hypothetical protein
MRSADLPMNELDGTDVDASRRLRDEQQDGGSSNSRPMISFCWLRPSARAEEPSSADAHRTRGSRDPPAVDVRPVEQHCAHSRHAGAR